MVVRNGLSYAISALPSGMRITAKSLLETPPLIVTVADESLEAMSDAVLLRKGKTASYKPQDEVQREYYPHFHELVEGKHPALKPWRVNFNRESLCISFFDYTNTETCRRGAVDLECIIFYRKDATIQFEVADETRLNPCDIQRIKLRYSEVHNGLQGEVDFVTAEKECYDTFKNVSLI